MSQLSVKKLRNKINFDTKREICRYAQTHPELAQKDLILHFKHLNIARSTMSDILKSGGNKDGSGYRERVAANPELEQALFVWFCDMRDHFLPISDDILISQARIFGSPEYFATREFAFSPCWLVKFKRRFSISLHTIQGESANISPAAVERVRAS